MKFNPKNPKFKERIKGQLEKQNFMHLIGIKVNAINAGEVQAFLEVAPKHFQHSGFLHGGVVSSIADIVAGFAACTLVAEDENVVTGEIKISYFAKGRGSTLKAVGKVIKPGRRVSFCEAEIYILENDSERMIAKASTSMITI